MTVWMVIAQYLLANWVELAGFLTTALGIWLTTKRLLICWPVVLAADVFYLIVFYRARLYSDALLQVFFLAFTLYGWWHWWRGVRAEGEVRVVPLGAFDEIRPNVEIDAIIPRGQFSRENLFVRARV